MFVGLVGVFCVIRVVFPQKYSEEILYASSVTGIEPDLIRAVIWTESKYDEEAVSVKGASGLMQMLDSTRIEQSSMSGYVIDGSAFSEIVLGSGYLARMINATDSLDDGLMAYNAGLRNVLTWDTPYKESVDYVYRVKLAYNIYRYIV